MFTANLLRDMATALPSRARQFVVMTVILWPAVARRIEVRMSAPWLTSCFHPWLEALEFFGDERGSAAMWQFLREVHLDKDARRVLAAPYSEEAFSQAVTLTLDVFEAWLSPQTHALLKVALATREFAPRVEAHQSIVDRRSSCLPRAVVYPGGHVACSPEELHFASQHCGNSSFVIPDLLGSEQFSFYSGDERNRNASGSVVELVANAAKDDVKPWMMQLHGRYFFLRHSFMHHNSYHNSAAFGKTYLQGFGANLDIKNMEYKNWDYERKQTKGGSGAIGGTDEEVLTFDGKDDDDIEGVQFAMLAKRRPELKQRLAKLRNALVDERSNDSAQLKIWRIRDLGLQAVVAVLEGHDALRMLADISQNFPSQAAALSATRVSNTIRTHGATMLNSVVRGVVPRPGTIYIGGVPMNIESPAFSVHSMMKLVRAELKCLAQLNSISPDDRVRATLLDPATLGEVETLGVSMGSKRSPRVDLLSGSKGAITYLNNLEEDARYKGWSRSVQTLLYPSWQLHAIAKNLFTVIIFVDAGTREALAAFRLVHILLDEEFPIRFGLVFMDAAKSEDATLDLSKPPTGAQIAALFSLLKNAKGVEVAWSWLRRLVDVHDELLHESQLDFISPTLGEVIDLFARIAARSPSSSRSSSNDDTKDKFNGEGRSQEDVVLRTTSTMVAKEDAWDALSPASSSHLRKYVIADVQRSQDFASMKGVSSNSFALNGQVIEGLAFQTELLPLLGEEQNRLAELVATSVLTDKTKSIYGKALLGAGKKEHLASRYSAFASKFFNSEKTFIFEAFKEQSLSWNYARPSKATRSLVSLIVDADCNTTAGKAVVEATLELADRGVVARVALLGNETSLYQQQAHSLRRSGASVGDAVVYMNGLKVDAGARKPPTTEDLRVIVDAENAVAEMLAAKIGLDEDYGANDAARDTAPWPTSAHLDLIGKARAFIGTRGQSSRDDPVAHVERILGLNSPLVIRRLSRLKRPSSGNLQAAPTESAGVVAVLDPLTEAAQRAAPVLTTLRDVVGLEVTLILVPNTELSEVPLQKYYRFALDAVESDSKTVFTSLPRSHVLTLRIDTPEAWDVQIGLADQDLDNLRCERDACGDAGSSDITIVEYKLTSLVVAGQCYDAREGRPPNGLQVELADYAQSSVADTIVMQNLGYFQLRASTPGKFALRLATGTPSAELYDIVASPPRTSLHGERSSHNALGDPDGPTLTSIDAIVADLNGETVQLRVRKKTGYEALSLLDRFQQEEVSDAEKHALTSSRDGVRAQADPSLRTRGLLGRLLSPLLSKVPAYKVEKNADAGDGAQLDTVHVFSLATGALYERFLKIMMLSVRKRTSGPVKFWLFENYLRPDFKIGAAALSKSYNFDVSYVTYKWPQWLRRQTIKQRIIWGYKILFLDVLFPLGIPKIIYVDADLIVRADLRELWTMDIGGRPYAYTPFCATRPETLGFQFWRSGYWKDHLRGRAYHISALYVVDLVKFRHLGVGDQLRALYDQLARDPNSLANLDQDLPNYAQHSIPIFSLPQEWLWYALPKTIGEAYVPFAAGVNHGALMNLRSRPRPLISATTHSTKKTSYPWPSASLMVPFSWKHGTSSMMKSSRLKRIIVVHRPVILIDAASYFRQISAVYRPCHQRRQL
mmetsp:Transcript_2448/g.8246  ORF Transcript_2448/g.8246 Transcript_2448/m.8246 type:complete len:1639 (-) Transcript_2448:772-5688(-)